MVKSICCSFRRTDAQIPLHTLKVLFTSQTQTLLQLHAPRIDPLIFHPAGLQPYLCYIAHPEHSSPGLEYGFFYHFYYSKQVSSSNSFWRSFLNTLSKKKKPPSPLLCYFPWFFCIVLTKPYYIFIHLLGKWLSHFKCKVHEGKDYSLSFNIPRS